MEKIIYNENESFSEIRINKPAKLNTLDEQVVQEFGEALDLFELSSNNKCLIRAEGPKSFCAGGDVVSVVNGVKEGRPYDFFFKQEYHLDQRLYETRGLIAHAHGIVMGGGLGVLMGCETKVLDPGCTLAMPEVTIGFFPDVGASFFLQNIQKSWRLFMTLTGARLNAFDFLELGLVDYLCPIETDSKTILNKDSLNSIHEKILKENTSYKDSFKNKNEAISKIESMESLEEFDEFARSEASSSKNEWLTQSLNTYLHGSPVSKVLTWQYFNWCTGKPRKSCFEQDLKLAEIVSASGDFAEGVRALLIDKDKDPKWRDSSINDCEKRLKAQLDNLFK